MDPDEDLGWGTPTRAFHDIVYTEPRSGVAVIRMNRPREYNAWTGLMSVELVEAMDAVLADDRVGAVVLTGTGRAFSAGGEADKILPTYVDSDDALRWARDAALLNLRNVLQVLKDFDKPLIAAVNGVAAGAGFAMTLMCDIRIASAAGRFGNIYMRRGTVPSMAPYYLPRVVGLNRACRLIFGDEVIGAAEAERIGLVSQVAPVEDFPQVVLDLAERIAAQPVPLLRLVKHLVRAGQDSDLPTVRRLGALSAAVARSCAMNHEVAYTTDGHVATLRLIAPVLSPRMVDELFAAAEQALQDDEVRVVVLIGTGEVFCDDEPVDPRSDGDLHRLFAALERVPSDALLQLDKPTIAAINGSATGIGCDLALACDMRVAADNARIATADLKRGLVPGVATYLLPRIVGLAKACELLYTAEPVLGAEAARIGLVEEAVPADRLEEAAYALAARVAKGPPVAMRFTKRAIYRGLDSSKDAAKEYTTMARTLGMRITDETREGFMSFVEKREPRF